MRARVFKTLVIPIRVRQDAPESDVSMLGGPGMKTTVAAVLVGALLGGSATSTATTGAWTREQGPYRCSGNAERVTCVDRKHPRWMVRITGNGSLGVHYGAAARAYRSGPFGVVFACETGLPLYVNRDACVDFRD